MKLPEVGTANWNTGWAFCGKCGKKISSRNVNEIKAGYHHRCQSWKNRHKPTIVLDIPTGKKEQK